MRRPPARRPRRVALALLTTLAACADDTATTPRVVEVAAQPCASPNRSFGLGVVVADDLVATAAHTVDGPLRDLSVDGVVATVVAIDPRTDLALLAVDIDAAAAELSTAAPVTATVLGTGRPATVRIVRTGTLVVHDATDRARHERQAHTFTPGVERGASGAPLVDDDGRVLGVVVLDRRRDDIAYAVAAAELAGLLDATRSDACRVCAEQLRCE
jgi:S1-C subfamily serine protease